MLQIDHVYEFFYKNIFKDFLNITLPNGVLPNTASDDMLSDFHVFNENKPAQKILFYDQEPVLDYVINLYSNNSKFDVELTSLVTSEHSNLVNHLAQVNNLTPLYYFFHGFAALDWYRGFYALNYNLPVIRKYTYDYVTFNRLVSNDRSYRCYFISQIIENNLLDLGQVSFGLDTGYNTWRQELSDPNTKLSLAARTHATTYLPTQPLIIDSEHVPGSASADIPRCVNDSFWHVVTETVFYYDKLHLTEKIFKPIASKQPFMLLAAPGNLTYLKSYGFKTFEGIIDESYDLIQDPDLRIQAVVKQLAWYCSLSEQDKLEVIKAIEPIVEYNFHHFYGKFKHIITQELLTNTKSLFNEIGYDDSTIAWNDLYKVLTT